MKVLVLSPVNPAAKDSGFKIAVASDVEALRGVGSEVTILCAVVNPTPSQHVLAGSVVREFPVRPGGRAHRVMRGLLGDVPTAVERYYTAEMSAAIRAEVRCGTFELVLVEDVSLARWLPLVREVLPDARVILRSHNDMGLVTAAQVEAAPAILKPLYRLEHRRWVALERFGLEQADETWAITAEEKQTLIARYGKPNVRFLPVALDVDRYATTVGALGSPARFGHLGTLDLKKSPGMVRFLRRIWPHIHSQYKEAELVLGGKVTASARLAGRSVTCMGYVEDELAFLASIRYFVNPQSMGAGIKLKSLVGMAAGRILVSTGVGVQGMNVEHGVHYWNIDTLEAADDLRSIWQDDALNRNIGAAGRSWVEEHHAPRVVEEVMAELLASPRSSGDSAKHFPRAADR